MQSIRSDDSTIARQARTIEILEDRVAELEKAVKDAQLHIICIGGPLNDNKLGYTKEQMVTFFRIKECLDV